jgi:CHAT domain-containing protein
VTVAELQRRLRGSGTAVIEIFALPSEVIAFCVTSDDLAVARSPVAHAELVALAAQATESGDPGARKRLFDLLFGPLRDPLASARHLIVVADPSLDGVPFGALYDSVSRTHLVRRMPVSMALSAGSLRVDRRAARPASLVAVALPSGDAAPLPDAERELTDVRALYALGREASGARATFPLLRASAPHADVVHIAGHTQRLRGAEDAALPFAGREGTMEWVSWRSIANAEPFLSRSTVVLSACETLRRPSSPRTFALSLGGAFLAAGARDVIGTLTAIRDTDARDLFFAVHGQLAAGVDAAEAVRRVQLAALDSGNPRATAWSAMAVLTDHIAQEESP